MAEHANAITVRHICSPPPHVSRTTSLEASQPERRPIWRAESGRMLSTPETRTGYSAGQQPHALAHGLCGEFLSPSRTGSFTPVCKAPVGVSAALLDALIQGFYGRSKPVPEDQFTTEDLVTRTLKWRRCCCRMWADSRHADAISGRHQRCGLLGEGRIELYAQMGKASACAASMRRTRSSTSRLGIPRR